MRFSYFSVLLIFLALLGTSFGDSPNLKKKILYFSNSCGFEHTTVRSEQGKPSVSDIAITEICEQAGIEVVCTKDGSMFDKDISEYDAFLFQTSGDLMAGAPGHPEWAMTENGWKNLLKEIRSGKGFLGFHPTTDSNRVGGAPYENSKEEEITEFTKLLGAEFTIHGPSQEADVSIVQPSQIPWLVAKGKSFRVFEEWYVHKNFGDDLHVFALLETGGMTGEMYDRSPCPILWGRIEGKGRSLYSAFGHYDEYWQNKDNMKLVLQLIQCALGETEIDLTPNIKTISPGANILRRITTTTQ